MRIHDFDLNKTHARLTKNGHQPPLPANEIVKPQPHLNLKT